MLRVHVSSVAMHVSGVPVVPGMLTQHLGGAPLGDPWCSRFREAT